MGLNMDEYVKVTAGATRITFLALAAKPQAGSRLNTAWNFEAYCFSCPGFSRSVTGLARVLDYPSGAPALRAGRADREEPA